MIDKSSFKGVNHVLHGVISPREGIGPMDLKIRELIERVRKGSIDELILWPPLGMEGDATAMYIKDELGNAGLLKSIRLSRGYPPGYDRRPSTRLW